MTTKTNFQTQNIYRGCQIDPYIDVNRPFYDAVANDYYFDTKCSKFGNIKGWNIHKGTAPTTYMDCCRLD